MPGDDRTVTVVLTVASDRALTTGAVARMLGISANHVRELIESGDLAALNIARSGRRCRYRIPPEALRYYVHTRQTAAP